MKRISSVEGGAEDAKHEPELGPPPTPAATEIRARPRGGAAKEQGLQSNPLSPSLGEERNKQWDMCPKGTGQARERRGLTPQAVLGRHPGKGGYREEAVRDSAAGRAGPPGMRVTGRAYV